MEQRRVGHTGLHVSPVGLGTLTWGRDTDADTARAQLCAYRDAGGNLIDTAGNYGDGEAEALLGHLLADTGLARDLVVVSKAGLAPCGQTVAPCASRHVMLDALDRTLTALRRDHLDVWLVQHFDPITPLDETLSALTSAVASGRVRYIGVSNYPTWALAEIATELRLIRTPLAVLEAEYSLLNRDLDKEGFTACDRFGAGVIAWSPLARGVLSGRYRTHTPPDSRAASPHLGGFVKPYLDERYEGAIEATCAAAAGLDLTPAQVAFLWAKDAPGVSSILLGSRTITQLTQLLDVADDTLPHQIRHALDDVTADLSA